MNTEQKTKKKITQEKVDSLIEQMHLLRSKMSELKKHQENIEFPELGPVNERNLLRVLIDHFPHTICLKDTKGRFIMFNKSVIENRELKSAEELLGKTDADIGHPDYVEQYRKDEDEIIRTGKPKVAYLEEGINIRGQKSWNITTKAPIKDDYGNVIAIAVVNQDITEQINNRQAMKESENKYKALFNNAAEGIIVADYETKRFQFSNPAICKMLGYTQDEMTGLTIHDIHPKEELPKIFEKFNKKKAAKLHDVPCICKDGSIIYTYISGAPIEIDSCLCIVGFFTDITEQRNTQQALQESESRLRLILDESFDGINIIEYDIKTGKRKLVLCNDRYVKMTGRKKEELMKSDDIREFSAGPQSKKVIEDDKNYIINLKHYTGQGSWKRPDKKENYHEWAAAPIKIDGKYYVIGIDRDVTERIKSERELKKAKEDLEKAKIVLEEKVKKRTIDLEGLNKSLKEENVIRRQAQEKLLLYRDQLRTLASELSLTEERTRKGIAKDVHDHIGQNLAMAKIKLQELADTAKNKETIEAVKDIALIISRTIDSTRTLTFEISPPVLYELGFEAAIEWLLKKIRKEHGLNTDFETDMRTKPLDENISVFLFQSVRELLNNIKKHSNAENVKISVCRLKNNIQVCVADDGKGFNWRKIKSFQESSSNFGLFSIRERLSCIDGKMEIESEPGKGAEITLTAPLNNKYD